MKTDRSLAAATLAAVETGVALEQSVFAAAQREAIAAAGAAATKLNAVQRRAVEGAIASVKAARPSPSAPRLDEAFGQ